MPALLPAYMKMLATTGSATIMKPEFFVTTIPEYIKKPVKVVAPVLKFPNGEVTPGYDISTRTNGVDQPRWPDNLGDQFIK